MIGRAVILCLSLVMAAPALAIAPGEALDDPVLEERARTLSQELRCLVCQNQSIDDSDAPLARDLRLLVRDRLTAGDTDEEVIDFVVARYGEFVLLRPRVHRSTWALWVAPFAVVLIGAGAIIFFLRRNKPAEKTAAPALSDAEKARLEEIVNSREEGDA